MVLWDSVSLFDTEEEKNQGYKDVMETTGVSPRDQYDIMFVHIGGVKIKKLKINILGVY